MVIETLVKKYTVAEFLELDLPEEDAPYELIEGEIVAKRKTGQGPSARHGKVMNRIGTKLENFAGEGKNASGTVYSACGCTLGRPEGSNYVIPDVAFVKAGRLPDDFDGPLTVVPDIIIEVISPTDDTQGIQKKVDAYNAAQVPLLWSIYLAHKFVLVYRAGAKKPVLLGFEDELDGGDILPGFKLSVNSLLA